MVDREKFTGMIVNPGSPNDGKTVGRATPYLRLPGAMEVATKLTSRKKPAPTETPVEQYVWVAGAGGLWVPDGRGEAWGIEMLRAGYRKGR